MTKPITYERKFPCPACGERRFYLKQDRCVGCEKIQLRENQLRIQQNAEEAEAIKAATKRVTQEYDAKRNEAALLKVAAHEEAKRLREKLAKEKIQAIPSRWQPGQSGNLAGRPKGQSKRIAALEAENALLKTLLLDALRGVSK